MGSLLGRWRTDQTLTFCQFGKSLAADLAMPATVWKGYLSFGLVSFPIRLFAAARPESVHFHMLHKPDTSRIKEVWYCAEENKPVEKSEIVKGYEYGRGNYVVLEEDELKKVAPPTAPEEAASKPYGLLLKAMADTQYYAVAKVTMHSREHIVIIRPAEGVFVN
jgi:DNA end-binding protein Ku